MSMYDEQTRKRVLREGYDWFLLIGPEAIEQCHYPEDDIRHEWFADGMRAAHEEYRRD